MAIVHSENGIVGYGCSRTPAGIGEDPSMEEGLNSPSVHYHRRMAVNTVPGPRFHGRVRVTNELTENGYLPVYATSAEMITISTARRDRYGYRQQVNLGARPAGYTLSDLTIRFANMSEQWRRTRNALQFTRGTIFLDLEVTIYVTDEARERPRCRQLIMQHELMHLEHEREIVNRRLPARLPTLPFIASDFNTPIPERDFDRRIRGDGHGRGSDLERMIQRSVWVIESSQMASQLHQDHPEHGAEILRCLGR